MSAHAFLSMNHINKSFNRVQVLNNVSLQVEQGEIHALLGENGAGKSTLMNILGGVYQPDSGTIRMNGQTVKMTNPRVSRDLGISFIHQELNVVPDLRVYENMFLGSELKNIWGFVQVKEMCHQTRQILTQLGVDINPKQYVRDLDTSYKQLIEISKALLHKSKLIIMDEPTSALAEHEVERLFDLMRNLKRSGVSIIYISHKLNEIKQICDRYTVLRDGEVVGTGCIKEEDINTMTRLMVGKTIAEDRIAYTHELGPVTLEVNDLSSKGLFKRIHFSVRQGEIVGFTGLVGDGRTELFESLFGYRKIDSGEVKVRGEVVNIDHPCEAIRTGIGFVPKDRKENAIVKDLSVVHNMSLSAIDRFEKYGFIQEGREWDKFQYYEQTLNIKVHHPSVTIDQLSGGNQQKVVIAKWLEVNPQIIVFDNPTQGIDVGAKQEIYEMLVRLAEKGKSVIVLSPEASEVLKICHKIYVMFQGEISAVFNGDEATEDEILGYATGSNREVTNIG